MTKRIITIVCEVDQPEANWIWESHMAVGGVTRGVSIISIYNDDQMKKLNLLEEKINSLQDILDENDLRPDT